MKISFSQSIAAFSGAAMLLISGCGYSWSDYWEANSLAHEKDFHQRHLNTPAQFYSEQIREAQKEVRAMRDLVFWRYADSVPRLASIAKNTRLGESWDLPVPKVGIPYLDASPKIDGKFTPGEWDQALTFSGAWKLNEKTPLKNDPSIWKVGYDGEYLYFAARYPDSEVFSFSRHGFGRGNDWFYLGDCFEIFLRPDLKSLHYFELLLNPEGKDWNMFHGHLGIGRWQMLNADFQAYRKNAASYENGVLTYETAIPMRILFGEWSFRGPRAGDRFSFIMVRCDKSRSGMVRTMPQPFLYDGHNIFGFIEAELLPGKKQVK